MVGRTQADDTFHGAGDQEGRGDDHEALRCPHVKMICGSRMHGNSGNTIFRILYNRLTKLPQCVFVQRRLGHRDKRSIGLNIGPPWKAGGCFARNAVVGYAGDRMRRRVGTHMGEVAPSQEYGGYFSAGLPKKHDDELLETGPGTAAGEYLRKFWHPVCLSSELTDLPLAVRHLGEDLVLFRDKSGRLGALHRHCSHRGTSLEYGIVSERGLRCCYHGWLFDVDGAVLGHAGRASGVPVEGLVPPRCLSRAGISRVGVRLLGPPRSKTEISHIPTPISSRTMIWRRTRSGIRATGCTFRKTSWIRPTSFSCTAGTISISYRPGWT